MGAAQDRTIPRKTHAAIAEEVRGPIGMIRLAFLAEMYGLLEPNADIPACDVQQIRLELYRVAWGLANGVHGSAISGKPYQRRTRP